MYVPCPQLSSSASRTEQILQDVDRLGEETLKEPKEYRHLDERLKEIEEELQKLTSVVEFEVGTQTHRVSTTGSYNPVIGPL